MKKNMFRITGMVLALTALTLAACGNGGGGVAAPEAIIRVSVGSDGEGNDASEYSSISADGRYVAFQSDATNLVAGDTNAQPDVFIHDRQTGATTRVSVATGGTQGNSYAAGTYAISADGRYVVFDSNASNLVSGYTNNALDSFIRDRQTGITTRVSIDSAGAQGNGHSYSPALSADGRHVSFYSDADNLVPGDANGSTDVFRAPNALWAP